MLDFLLSMGCNNGYKDYLREARKNNLLHIYHQKPSGPKTFYRQAIIYFGRLLLIWGWRLQTKRGDSYTHSKA